MADAYTIGIEEEYFLVDAESKMVAEQRPEAFFAAAKAALGPQLMGEMLQSQIEVATVPHRDMAAAHAELRHLRATIAAIAAQHGLAILAAGTHPTAAWETAPQSPAAPHDTAAHQGLALLAAGTRRTAAWETALQSPADRYDTVMHDLQMIGQRNMLCGLHVHVELPDREDRVAVMTRRLPHLPLFVALATSSPC